jgi:hypothetical protein
MFTSIKQFFTHQNQNHQKETNKIIIFIYSTSKNIFATKHNFILRFCYKTLHNCFIQIAFLTRLY